MVVIQSSFIDVVISAIREDSRPRYREAVVGHLQCLQHLHVLINLVVTITSNVAIVTAVSPQGSMGKLVPDTQSLSMCSPGPFNLKYGDYFIMCSFTLELIKEYTKYVCCLCCLPGRMHLQYST